ncbi:alcohol dehydrogenase catalytic domain-containing protein [Agromyces soli]
MKAALLTDHALEALDVLELDVPRPAAGEVLVRVETVGVNQLDRNVIAGHGPGAAAKLPRVLGIDPAGTVVAVGEGVDAARVGEAVVVKPNIPCGHCPRCAAGREADCPAQTVVGVHRDGGAAQFVTVPARNAMDRRGIPAAVATAAVHSVPIVLNALETAGLVAGERVLVIGAAGTLGGVATQLVVALGGELVAASRSSVALPPGAQGVRAADPTALAAALAPHAPFDVVLDVGGHGPGFAAGIAALGWGGRAVTCAASVDPRLEIDQRDFYLRRKRLIGVASADFAQVDRALALVRAGLVTPTIAARHPLDEIVRAYRETAAAPGKVLIEVAPAPDRTPVPTPEGDPA